ncbi:Asp-tRNA(Asn)/Glu-tRNA(Gln) amidotransferase GatCAB subunit A [Planomicrobium chinense]|uniref:amidase n=1 Tax=Planococcus chinensis TaxID=272917 RepID=UPI001CC7A13C|nr:amidase [Planococcus chinensis]MBZ5202013.1 Asp-tRNA(Asn)/Glu-tRNA(Gln) amidotransferase GatCAB subunit A [Planococcus chinensis]
MTQELAAKSIGELAPLLKDKEISPVELTEAVLQNVEQYDGQVNAYIEIQADQARQAAQTAENEMANGQYRGPLHGIPMALKDILYFNGETATMGSEIHRHFVPEFDATVVAKLKSAGVVFTGKLNMHEYAWGATTTNPHFGACKNPWDLSKIPGGSSGGSGAAVAADMAIASLGTDTGGSIRIPAASCGIIGLKPTHGRISKFGCFPLAWSLDHIGPMTKTVHDAALLLETLAGYDPKDPTSVNKPARSYSTLLSEDLKGEVIGIDEDYFFRNVDKRVDEAVRQALSELEKLGARIEPVKIPSLAQSEYAELVTITSEASAIHHKNLLEHPDKFGEDTRFLLEFGELVTAVDYLQAQQIRRKLNNDFAQVFKRVDVLISPTLPFLPPLIGDSTVDINGQVLSFLDEVIRFTGPGNLTGLPALSIPCGVRDGLPVGLQIMGPAFEEEKVLNVAYALEKLQLMKGQKPELVKTASL